MENKGSNMDAEVKKELLDIESRLNATLQTLVSRFSREIKTAIKELFNKDIDHITEKMRHFEDNHKEHYDNDKIRKKEIDELGKVITQMTIAHQTKDKLIEQTVRRREIGNGTIVTLCTVFSLLTGIIVYFIK